MEVQTTTVDLTDELTPTDDESLWTLCRELDLVEAYELDPARSNMVEVTRAVGDAIYEMVGIVQEPFLEEREPENWTW